MFVSTGAGASSPGYGNAGFIFEDDGVHLGSGILHLAFKHDGTTDDIDLSNVIATIDADSNILMRLDNQYLGFGATSTDLRISSDGTDGVFTSTGDMFFNATGNVKFGTHSAITTETLSGFITIKDSSGATRKLAVVS